MPQQIERLAKQAIIETENFNPNARRTLGELFNKVQDSSSKLLSINDYASVGSAYAYMLAQKISDGKKIIYLMTVNGFYCLTKAIEKSPTDYSLKRKRLMLYEISRDPFNELIMCALNISINPMDSIGSTPAWMQARDAIFKMEIVDFFDTDKRLQGDWSCKNRKPQYEKMIKENHFRNKNIDELKAEGNLNITKCLKWLENCYSQY